MYPEDNIPDDVDWVAKDPTFRPIPDKKLLNELKTGNFFETKISKMIKADSVNHPLHYNNHPSGVEAIEIVRHHNFNIGNVIKYCWRSGLKPEGNTKKQIEDLEKALFYLKDEIQRLRG